MLRDLKVAIQVNSLDSHRTKCATRLLGLFLNLSAGGNVGETQESYRDIVYLPFLSIESNMQWLVLQGYNLCILRPDHNLLRNLLTSLKLFL